MEIFDASHLKARREEGEVWLGKDVRVDSFVVLERLLCSLLRLKHS